MLSYLLQRLLLLIPMLVLVSLLGFGIKVYTATDPAQPVAQGENPQASPRLPVFYITVSTYAFPDTLYRIPGPGNREALTALTYRQGNWPQISHYYQALKAIEDKHKALARDSIKQEFYYQEATIQQALNESRFTLSSLMTAHQDERISKLFKQLKGLYAQYPFFQELRRPLQKTQKAYVRMLSTPQAWKNYLPVIHWNGSHNQYHRWLEGIVTQFDFGNSYQTGEPVMARLGPRLWWTLSLALAAVGLAYLVSLPLGIYAAYRRNTFFDRISGSMLFAFAASPTFFVGTLLIFLLANPDMLAWFPETGVEEAGALNKSTGFLEEIRQQAAYLVLPLITYVYGQVAFLSRQMRAGMLEVINRDYIRMARAKGLSERKVLLKHALRNAVLPIITLFATAFPLALGSAVIIEGIFSIPGIGWELYQAILRADYPVIVAIFSITGLVTLVSFVIIDVLYALVDPRITNR